MPLEYLVRRPTLSRKDMEVTLPDEVAVMTLPGAAFFLPSQARPHNRRRSAANPALSMLRPAIANIAV